RIKAAEVLGRMGPLAKPAIPALLNLLKGSDIEARLQAALALWRIERHSEQTVPVLASLLKSCTPRQGSIGGGGGRSGAPLCQLAAEALGQIGPEARPAVPALLQALKNPQFAAHRSSYALALWKIDHQLANVAVPALIEVLAGTNH